MSAEKLTSKEAWRVIFQQNAIEWEHIFQGRLSVSWGAIQDEYYAWQAHTADTEQA